MNWLLIIVAIFLLLCAFNGYRLGFIKKLFTTFSFIITIVAAAALTPYVSQFLENSTPIQDTIKKGTSTAIEDAYINNEENANAKEEIMMPTIVKKILSENESGDSITADITDYISKQLTNKLINAISFAISFIIITIVLRTTVFTLDIIANLPIIKGINQYAGLILGAGEGLVIVWLFFLLLTLMGNTEFGAMLNKYIEDSAFLSFIYNNNYFYKLF
jgi:uncharacterized membrane protein required for colicin V production